MVWKEMARYRSGTPDGNTEEHVLEQDENGNFRVRNDFGNSVFEFERMAGYEFFRKVKHDIENEIADDLNELWNDTDTSGYDDCDSTDNKYNSYDSDSFGTD
tara:strand:+ start:563 stop:868 length:306 start_codon:yes stop_codon:yes gene_type:complete